MNPDAMNNEPKKPKGGYRPGAGRPVSLDPADKMITCKVTETQRQAFNELGGSRWLKRLINEYLAGSKR